MKLPYLVEEKAGMRTYRYVRKGKGPRVPISAEPGTADFAVQYAAALSAVTSGTAEISSARYTFRYLVSSYLKSAGFQKLGKETQRVRRRVIEQFLHQVAGTDYRKITALRVIELLEEKAGVPEAAMARLKAIRAVLKFAVRRKLLKENVATSVDVKEYYKDEVQRATQGHTAWTRELIEQYFSVYELGDREHLLMSILLFTGCRISDAAMLGPVHEKNGYLVWNETKGRNTYSKDATIVPIPAPLRMAIDAAPTGDLVYMVTEIGLPYSVKGLGQWFVKRCRHAGIPAGYSAHGVRKAAATFIAEGGGTENELMAMFGWTQSKQARLYTRSANNKLLATRAAGLLLGETQQEQTPLGNAPKKTVYNV